MSKKAQTNNVSDELTALLGEIGNEKKKLNSVKPRK